MASVLGSIETCNDATRAFPLMTRNSRAPPLSVLASGKCLRVIQL